MFNRKTSQTIQITITIQTPKSIQCVFFIFVLKCDSIELSLPTKNPLNEFASTFACSLNHCYLTLRDETTECVLNAHFYVSTVCIHMTF